MIPEFQGAPPSQTFIYKAGPCAVRQEPKLCLRTTGMIVAARL